MMVRPLPSKSKAGNDTSPAMSLLYKLNYWKPVIPLHFFFYKDQIIFAEARCSYSKMAKISNFAHTLPLFYAFKMLFRMSSFISNNSMIRNFASSWVTSPDERKSEPNCSYKVCSYIEKV